MLGAVWRIVALAVLAIVLCHAARAGERPEKHDLPVPVEVLKVERADWDRTSPESAYFGIRSANLADDGDWILAGFAPDDRQNVHAYLQNPDMRAANSRAQRAVTRELISELLTYKGFVIVAIEAEESEGRSYHKFIPMTETAEGWAVTNVLRSDPEFQALLMDPQK